MPLTLVDHHSTPPLRHPWRSLHLYADGPDPECGLRTQTYAAWLVDTVRAWGCELGFAGWVGWDRFRESSLVQSSLGVMSLRVKGASGVDVLPGSNAVVEFII